VGTPEGKSPLGRPRRRWEDNIKTVLQEVAVGAWTGLIRLWIGTVGGALLNEEMNPRFHKMRGIS